MKGALKQIVCLFGIFSILSITAAYAQQFGPPMYIADPVNMKCRYYFAGDPKHFNPRHENYTINIGYTTDFKSEEQACEFFRCVYTNGTIKVDKDKKPIEKGLCLCREDSYWDNETGCIKINKLEVKNENKQNWLLSRIWKKWKRNFCEE